MNLALIDPQAPAPRIRRKTSDRVNACVKTRINVSKIFLQKN